MERRRWWVLAVLALVMLACEQAPTVDVQAEEQAIRQLDEQWVQAVTSKDTMAIGNMYAEDGVFMPANGPRVTGRAAIRQGWAGLLQAPNLSLHFAPDKIEVASSGDLAYDLGSYHLGMDTPQGRLEDTGKYVVVWKKVNGAWQAAADIFNSDLPMPGSAMPADTVQM